jgi:hypothetical protein
MAEYGLSRIAGHVSDFVYKGATGELLENH